KADVNFLVQNNVIVQETSDHDLVSNVDFVQEKSETAKDKSFLGQAIEITEIREEESRKPYTSEELPDARATFTVPYSDHVTVENVDSAETVGDLFISSESVGEQALSVLPVSQHICTEEAEAEFALRDFLPSEMPGLLFAGKSFAVSEHVSVTETRTLTQEGDTITHLSERKMATKKSPESEHIVVSESKSIFKQGQVDTSFTTHKVMTSSRDVKSKDAVVIQEVESESELDEFMPDEFKVDLAKQDIHKKDAVEITEIFPEDIPEEIYFKRKPEKLDVVLTEHQGLVISGVESQESLKNMLEEATGEVFVIPTDISREKSHEIEESEVVTVRHPEKEERIIDIEIEIVKKKKMKSQVDVKDKNILENEETEFVTVQIPQKPKEDLLELLKEQILLKVEESAGPEVFPESVKTVEEIVIKSLKKPVSKETDEVEVTLKPKVESETETLATTIGDVEFDEDKSALTLQEEKLKRKSISDLRKPKKYAVPEEDTDETTSTVKEIPISHAQLEQPKEDITVENVLESKSIVISKQTEVTGTSVQLKLPDESEKPTELPAEATIELKQGKKKPEEGSIKKKKPKEGS
ncbi:Uncharacterised protein PB.8262, partial [Pycnogonum litorale]